MKSKSLPFSDCLYYTANVLSRVMTRMADDAFASTGLTSSYAFLLMLVNASPGIQPLEISREMMLKPSTITRFIEKMEYRGFLQRKPEGRSTKVYPTQKAVEINADIQKAWERLFGKYASPLGTPEANGLIKNVFEASQKLEAYVHDQKN